LCAQCIRRTEADRSLFGSQFWNLIVTLDIFRHRDTSQFSSQRPIHNPHPLLCEGRGTSVFSSSLNIISEEGSFLVLRVLCKTVPSSSLHPVSTQLNRGEGPCPVRAHPNSITFYSESSKTSTFIAAGARGVVYLYRRQETFTCNYTKWRISIFLHCLVVDTVSEHFHWTHLAPSYSVLSSTVYVAGVLQPGEMVLSCQYICEVTGSNLGCCRTF
jgi:hypothetical protein